MRDILTKAFKEVLLSDNVITEAEVWIICIAARSRCSRPVDTAGQLLHHMDDIVESYISLRAWIGPIPTVGSRQLGHSGLNRFEKILEIRTSRHARIRSSSFLTKKVDGLIPLNPLLYGQKDKCLP